MNWSRLDWPLIGALSGFAAAAAAVAIIAMVVLQPTPAPSKKAPSAHTTAALSPAVQRPAVVPVLHAPPLPELKPPPLVLTAPSAHAAPAAVAAGRPPIVTAYAVEPARKPPPAAVQQALAPETQRQPAAKPIKLETPGQPNSTEQWRVVKAANASAFNLGGHISRAGVVDDMANPHLRDAFKKHPNFHKLPPHIRMHIEMQNINLNRVAPYRHLLGIDDRKIEQEQGIRFERVIASR
jgi:hypothetical protein